MHFDRQRFERPPRPDQEAAPRKRRFNRFLIFGIPVFTVVALYVLLIVATMADDVFFPGNEIKPPFNLPGLDSGENPDAADINERINIVFLGLDRRLGVPEGTAALTDSVFVLTVDPFSKTAGVFSIPRDLLVDIPDGEGGYQTDRINVVWETGEFVYEDYSGGGPGLVKDTIEHNFDIPIDNYVILDFQDFIALIDEVGGVDVDVPSYVVDPDYTDCYGCAGHFVEFLPGLQHMDGKTALAYARLRKSDNDFKRIERQQLVIQATAEKALDTNLLSTQALDLYDKYNDAVETDISDLKVPGLAKLAQQVGLDNIRMVSIASATYACGSQCTGAVLLADWDEVEALKAQVFGDGRIQAEAAQVELQNGSEQEGLAAEFAGVLHSWGIPDQSMSLSDAAGIYTRSMIVDLSGKGYTAQKLAEWLNLSEDRIIDGSDPIASTFVGSDSDIVVVLGTDARLATAVLPASE